jgi:SRSO17 transposase
VNWVRCRAVIDRTATARVQRLIRWLKPFQRCFGHRAQRLARQTYVHGLFSDSDRKSMQAMVARVTDPITYQGFQHFITHAVWDADHIWRRLLEMLPERSGVLIIDGTSFPKQGIHSVGVARQYCGALGKIANCQVAVTAALWTGVRAWMTGALLYLPTEWLSDRERRAVAQIPGGTAFQEKWRQALTLIRRARAAGVQITAVLADAEFGDVTTFRRALHRWGLPDAGAGASTLGDRATVPGTQNRARIRPLRRPLVSGMAPSCRAHRHRLRLLQRERMRGGPDPSLTFPGIRAIVQEIFTALLLAQQPNYFKRIQELQQINLRI